MKKARSFVNITVITGLLISSCLNAALSKPGRLQDKVAIVVGASMGIGKVIAERFAEEGATVLLVSRNKELLEQNVAAINNKGGQAWYLVGDVKNKSDMHRAVNQTLERHGRIDILCYNAGIFPKTDFETMTSNQWHDVIDTNLTGCFYATQAVTPIMKKQRYGKIVFISSISGPRVGLPNRAHYTAAKAGMIGFMKTIAMELAPYGITVNATEPGLIMTEGVENLYEDHISKMVKAIPMGFAGASIDVANATVFLASDDSSFTTGASLIIDGGQSIPESHFEMPRLSQPVH